MGWNPHTWVFGEPENTLFEKQEMREGCYKYYVGIWEAYKIVKVFVGDWEELIKNKDKYIGTMRITHVITNESGKTDETLRSEFEDAVMEYMESEYVEMTQIKVGDTVTTVSNPASSPLPGYQPMKSMVFCGIYPILTELPISTFPS